MEIAYLEHGYLETVTVKFVSYANATLRGKEMWRSDMTSAEDEQTDREIHAGGNVAVRNFPPPENPSIIQFSKQRSGGFHLSRLLLCLPSPSSCRFLISLPLSNTIWKDKTLLIGDATTTVYFAPLSVFNSDLAHSSRLTSTLYIWVDFCRFKTKLVHK